MALEREILKRIQFAIESNDLDQERLNRALLGDLMFRKSQGLLDTKKLLTETSGVRLPSMETERDKKSRRIAETLNRRVGSTLSDDVDISRLYQDKFYHPGHPVPEWVEAINELARPERSIVYSRLHLIHYDKHSPNLHTVGGIRSASLEDFLFLRNVGPQKALFLKTVFALPSTESTT